MRRRNFVKGMIGLAVASPLVARAQQSERVRRLGVLSSLAERDPSATTWLTELQEALQRLGWEQARNILIEHRLAAGDEDRLTTYAAELVTMTPDVIFAIGTPALAALHRQTHSLPIVFVQVSDPVKLGFVASLSRPAGNVTGFANFEHSIAAKWLELLKDTAPGTAQVAVIFDPESPSQAPYLQAIETAAPSFRLRLNPAEVRNATEIQRNIDAFAQEPNGALLVLPSVPAISHRQLIIALAARHRLPAIYPYRVFATDGGLISYGIDLGNVYRRAASYVDVILKGAKPGDLPIQLPTKFELVVNLKTAKLLGLTIPESFLQSADEVIE